MQKNTAAGRQVGSRSSPAGPLPPPPPPPDSPLLAFIPGSQGMWNPRSSGDRCVPQIGFGSEGMWNPSSNAALLNKGSLVE